MKLVHNLYLRNILNVQDRTNLQDFKFDSLKVPSTQPHPQTPRLQILY